MKIQTILSEAKFSRPEYAYHATRADNLKSILKNGLVPNFKDDGYGSNETSEFGYTLTPLKGIYFTRSAKDAVFIAKSLMGEAIVLVCKIQPKQVELDEDRMNTAVLEEKRFLSALKSSLDSNFDYDVEKFVESGVIDKIISAHVRDVLANLELDDRAKKNAVEPIVKHLNNLADFYIETEVGGNLDETSLKASQNEVTKALRLLAHRDKATHHTFKLNANVGFSGSNRIVGIYNIETRLGWGDLGDLYGYAYHIVKNPLQILTKK